MSANSPARLATRKLGRAGVEVTELGLGTLLGERRNVGADFSSASRDFKALGAFFCNSSSRLISRRRAR